MVKCNTCGGVYEPTLADGMQYFHACPPLSEAEKRAALDAGTLILSRAAARRLEVAEAEDGKAPVAAGEPSRVDRVLAELVIERPRKRDENIVPGAFDDGERTRIKAEGAGVTELDPDSDDALIRR